MLPHGKKKREGRKAPPLQKRVAATLICVSRVLGQTRDGRRTVAVTCASSFGSPDTALCVAGSSHGGGSIAVAANAEAEPSCHPEPRFDRGEGPRRFSGIMRGFFSRIAGSE